MVRCNHSRWQFWSRGKTGGISDNQLLLLTTPGQHTTATHPATAEKGRHVMVYVAFGLLIASVSFFCYAYKQSKWEIRWSRSKSSIPTLITSDAADTHSHEYEVKPDDGKTKAPEPAGVVEKPCEEGSDRMKSMDGESQAESHTPQHVSNPPLPPSGLANPESPITDKPAETTKAESFFEKSEDAAKAAMQPPARPGPRLRPKVKSPTAPPSRPQPDSTSLRVPPTASSTLRPPPSAASTLRAPPQRVQASLSPLSVLTSSSLPSSKRPSKKVILEPGHSPLDWANLTHNPPSSTYLRGEDVPPSLIRVPPSLLRYHNGRKGKNAWGVWQGKVYNLTPYLKFHPGGVDELMKGAGRDKDGERLFLEVHPWVNWEGLLGECMVGILVSEEEGNIARKESGGLDDMD
ncbi:MAG: hypothetical protein LQ350_005852 [Teloschistes chrysophthalmus]|nr:MAG: hypothetical protein LQ350_005852 [Niorma chrysophthalma]